MKTFLVCQGYSILRSCVHVRSFISKLIKTGLFTRKNKIISYCCSVFLGNHYSRNSLSKRNNILSTLKHCIVARTELVSLLFTSTQTQNKEHTASMQDMDPSCQYEVRDVFRKDVNLNFKFLFLFQSDNRSPPPVFCYWYIFVLLMLLLLLLLSLLSLIHNAFRFRLLVFGLLKLFTAPIGYNFRQKTTNKTK